MKFTLILGSVLTSAVEAQYGPAPNYHYAPVPAPAVVPAYAPVPAPAVVPAYAPVPAPAVVPAYAPVPAPAAPGYVAPPAAPAVQPYGYPAAAPAVDPKVEFDQFWSNVDLCHAENGLKDCLLTCNGLQDFFDGVRVSNCIGNFVEGYCGALSSGEYKGCKNGRVEITTDSCQTSAYADAIMVSDRITRNYERQMLGSIKQSSWSFSITRMALNSISSTTDCVMEAYFYFLNQCALSSYIDKDTVTCVEEHITDTACTYASAENDGFNVERLEQLLEEDVPKAHKYVASYYGHDNVKEALEDLAEEFVAINKNLKPMLAEFDNKKHESGLNICPVNYLWMNYGKDEFDIAGIPESLVAFHFPRDGPMYKPDSSEQTLMEDYFAQPVPPAPAPLQQTTTSGPPPPPTSGAPEATTVNPPRDWNLDPFTPKHGLSKRCKEHFQLSKSLFILADGYDIGNMCYTIDGYEIDFIESGNSERLTYDWVHQEFVQPSTSPAPVALMSDGYYASSVDAPELADIVPDNAATCHEARWRTQKSCVSHLSRWAMKVRCCRSYAQAKKAAEAPAAYPAQTNDLYHVAQDAYVPPYAPYYSPYYGQRSSEANALLGDQYYAPAPAPVAFDQYAPVPAPAAFNQYAPVPAPAAFNQYATTPAAAASYETYSAESYEFVHTVYSNVNNGSLVDYSKGQPVPINNGGLAALYSTWAQGAKAATETARAVANSADQLKDAVIDYYYGKFYSKTVSGRYTYSYEFNLPSVYPKHYIRNDKNYVNTCQRLNIKLDFDAVIPLKSGKCFPQSCLVAQYASCMENPAESHKAYVAPAYTYSYGPPAAPAVNHYGGYPAPAPSSGYGGYSFLSNEKAESIASYSVCGFVAGLMVVALIQFVTKGRRSTIMSAEPLL